jgi:hypothetical protein
MEDDTRKPPYGTDVRYYEAKTYFQFLLHQFSYTPDRNPWSLDSYQWRTVHARILSFAIAFAPLCLPAYVQLWILDWEPRCYLSRPIWKIQLIQSVIESVRKVRRERGEFITRIGRATRPRYVVQKLKI